MNALLDRFERYVNRSTVNRAEAWWAGFTAAVLVVGIPLALIVDWLS